MIWKANNRTGSISVEAAMIVPIVIIVVMIVLTIMLIIFQTCIMQVTADNVAERAAAVYFNDGDFTDGSTSKADISKLGLYRRWSPNLLKRQSDIKAYALGEMQAKSILKARNTALELKQSNHIITQKLEVTLSADYDNPMGKLTALWGLKEKIRLRVRAEVTADDPAEFIRNTDFIMDTASQVPVIGEFEDKWQEIVNKITEYVNKLAKE